MRLLLSLVLVASMLTAFSAGLVDCQRFHAQPSCSVIVQAGTAVAADQLIQVRAPQPVDTGQIVIPTVQVDPSVGLVKWIRAAVSSTGQVAARADVLPDVVDAQVVSTGSLAMTGSQVSATVAGFRAAGVEVGAGDGLVVHGLAEASRAQGLIWPGDVLVAVDDVVLASAADLVSVVAPRRPGEVVDVTLRRDGESQRVPVELASGPRGAAILGVIVSTDLQLPTRVRYLDRGIAGPSAGLGLALSIADQLSPEDLTGGRPVAATGVVAVDGTIDTVAGARFKVLSAERAFAAMDLDRSIDPVVFVPRDNVAEAARAKVDMRMIVVGVASVADAVSALNILRSGAVPAGAVVLGD